MSFYRSHRWTDEQDAFLQLRSAEFSIRELSDQLGVNQGQVRRRLTALGLTYCERKRFPTGQSQRLDRMPNDPTPEEILAKCEEIRRLRQEQERHDRNEMRQPYERMVVSLGYDD